MAIRSVRIGSVPSCASSKRAAWRSACSCSSRARPPTMNCWHSTPRVTSSSCAPRPRAGAGFLDAGDTPAFRGVYEAAAGVVGATLSAMEAILRGECRRAFVPIAGLHHAARDRAAGFCVFNDCGVAIEQLKRAGLEARCLRRHRRSSRRRRVLRLRGGCGGDLRRPARGRALPVPGHRLRRRDRPRRGRRHQAQRAAAAGGGRCGVRAPLAGGARAPGEVRAGIRASAVRRRQHRGRPDHAPALLAGGARPRGPRARRARRPSGPRARCWRSGAEATIAPISRRPGPRWSRT